MMISIKVGGASCSSPEEQEKLIKKLACDHIYKLLGNYITLDDVQHSQEHRECVVKFVILNTRDMDKLGNTIKDYK